MMMMMMMAVKHLYKEEGENPMMAALAVFFDGVDLDRVGWVAVCVAGHR